MDVKVLDIYLSVNRRKEEFFHILQFQRIKRTVLNKSPILTEQLTRSIYCIAIPDRLRMDSWSSFIRQTGVISRLNGPNFPLPDELYNQKDTHTLN